MAAKRVRTARPKLEDLVATYQGVQHATLSEELPRSGAWSHALKLAVGNEICEVARPGALGTSSV